jgi:hypothetical protein
MARIVNTKISAGAGRVRGRGHAIRRPARMALLGIAPTFPAQRAFHDPQQCRKPAWARPRLLVAAIPYRGVWA